MNKINEETYSDPRESYEKLLNVADKEVKPRIEKAWADAGGSEPDAEFDTLRDAYLKAEKIWTEYEKLKARDEMTSNMKQEFLQSESKIPTFDNYINEDDEGPERGDLFGSQNRGENRQAKLEAVVAISSKLPKVRALTTAENLNQLSDLALDELYYLIKKAVPANEAKIFEGTGKESVKKTAMFHCDAKSCDHYQDVEGTSNCILKQISVSAKGECNQYEPVPKVNESLGGNFAVRVDAPFNAEEEHRAMNAFSWKPKADLVTVESTEGLINDDQIELNIILSNGDEIEYLAAADKKQATFTVNNRQFDVSQYMEGYLGSTGKIIGDLLLAYGDWKDEKKGGEHESERIAFGQNPEDDSVKPEMAVDEEVWERDQKILAKLIELIQKNDVIYVRVTQARYIKGELIVDDVADVDLAEGSVIGLDEDGGEILFYPQDIEEIKVPGMKPLTPGQIVEGKINKVTNFDEFIK